LEFGYYGYKTKIINMAIAKASQNFVPIKEIKNGVVVLKDGGLRAVVMVSSINLSLKAYEEQRATFVQFQNFLNTLDFPIQIVIQSRKLDIRPYLTLLEARMREQTEPLLKVQTREYINFIRSFTESVNIMTKKFFVIVPYSAPTGAAGLAGALGGLTGALKPKKEKEEEASFEEKANQLDERVSTILGGLGRLGIRGARLGTEELIELYYKTFNPGEITGAIRLE